MFMLAVGLKPSPAFLEDRDCHREKADGTHDFSHDFEPEKDDFGFKLILLILGPDADEYTRGLFMPMAASEESDVFDDDVDKTDVDIDAMMVVRVVALFCQSGP